MHHVFRYVGHFLQKVPEVIKSMWFIIIHFPSMETITERSGKVIVLARVKPKNFLSHIIESHNATVWEIFIVHK